MDSWSIILEKIHDFSFKKGLHSFVNPYSMLLLEKKEKVAKDIDFWYIDGISLVNLVNKKKFTNHTRQSFDDTSLAPMVFKFAKDNNLKIAIIGTTHEYIERVIPVFKDKFGVTATYYRNGYFNSDEEKDACMREIMNKNIEIVISGMGTPYQEEFLIALKEKGWQGYGFTCGGYLHQTAKREVYYPIFFDKWNIRWIYRIIDEPKLIKRYFYLYPIFFLRFKYLKRRLKKGA